MWILIVSLIVLTIVAMLIGKGYYYRINKKIEKGELEEIPPVVEVDEECCGQHETCEKDSLLAAVSKSIEYYNDEEPWPCIGRIYGGRGRRVPRSDAHLQG